MSVATDGVTTVWRMYWFSTPAVDSASSHRHPVASVRLGGSLSKKREGNDINDY